MSWKNDIRDSVMALSGTTNLKGKADIYYAIVDDYDESNRTCSCTLVSGKSDISLDSVSLMSEVNDGLLMLPTKGSTVIIAKTAHTMPYVMMFSQIDKILIIVGDTLFSLVDGTVTISQGDDTKFTLAGGVATMQQGDDNKFTLTSDTALMQQGELKVTLTGGLMNIKNNSQDFTAIMKSVLNHIIALIVATSTGPASLDPTTVTNFNTDLSNLTEILN